MARSSSFSRSGRKSPLDRARPLQLERLESREVFAAGIVGSDLMIYATNNSDRVEVWESGNQIRVSINNQTQAFNKAAVRGAIKCYLYGGHDRFQNSTNLNVQVWGGDGDDTITNYLQRGQAHFMGERGNDRLTGGYSNDYLDGGEGHDSIWGDSGSDVIWGRGGNDALRGEDGNDTIFGDDGADSLYGGNGQDYLYGGNQNDFLEGGSGDDVLMGEYGNDTLRGGDGHDVLRGGMGNDSLYGDSGLDWLYGDDGNDALYSYDSDRAVSGGNGRDYIYKNGRGYYE